MLNKKLLLVRLVIGLISSMVFYESAYSNMPVIDLAASIQHATMIANQVNQYKTQLNQYDNMLKNSVKLDKYTWDQANTTMNNLVNSIDTLNQYKQQMGGLDSYLSRYQTSDHYRNSACFNGGNCTSPQLQALRKQEAQSSEAQKRANDAMLRGIDQQQVTMKADANKLIQLQQQAQGAEGQLAAIHAANQLASAQTNQLLQIRGLLVAEQNAEATRAAAVADREAIQAVADERFRAGSFKKSPPKSW